jgi:hypothetical protein
MKLTPVAVGLCHTDRLPEGLEEAPYVDTNITTTALPLLTKN